MYYAFSNVELDKLIEKKMLILALKDGNIK